MIQIKYNPNTNSIVGFYGNHCVNLHTGRDIETPEKLIPVKPFMKKAMVSDWEEIPYGEVEEYCAFFPDTEKDYRPRHMNVDGIRLEIEYTRNEVNEPYYRLYGQLPKYVLDGITHLITTEWYQNKVMEDIADISYKYFMHTCDGVPMFDVDEIIKYMENHPDCEHSSCDTDETIPHSLSGAYVYLDGEFNFFLRLDDDFEKHITTIKQYRDAELKFQNVWYVDVKEDGKYHIGGKYFGNEESAKTYSSEVWHSYISRDIRGFISKL